MSEKEYSNKKRSQMGKSNKTSGDLSSFVFDKLQPQALEMEEAVLGAMMLDKDAVSNVIDILKAESFYLDKHQKIYACFQELFLKNKPIDLLTVTEQLKKSGVLEEIGGAFYLTQLASRIGSTANVEHHARVVSEKHILRELIKSSNMIIKGAYDETIDVFDLLDKSEQALFEITDQNLRRNFESMGNLLNQAIKQMEELAQNDNAVVGIPSGFTALDRVTSGWQRSDLIIMAARPGMGKTSMVLALARNACVDHKKPIAFFSLEMSSLQLVNRLISSEAELPQEKMKRGELESYEWEQLHSKIQNLSDAKLFIDDTPGLNIFELRAKCRRLKMQHDIQMVVIDYLQLMSGTGDKKGNREQEISQISRALKGIAKELNIPVIALSQLSRAVETRGGNKRPQLSDLRECITGDTKIFLPDSGEYIPVKELLGKNGFNVLALNETDYKLQKSKCLDVWETGKKEIYELTTQSGYKIKTSLNHPFYTVNGWQQLVDLKEGDLVATPRVLKSKGRNELKEEEIIILAHMIGDGCYVDRQPIHYTSQEQASLKIVESCANSLWGTKCRLVPDQNSKSCFHLYLPSPYRLTHNVHNPFVNLLHKVDLDKARSHEKQIPNAIFKSNEKHVALFLNHLCYNELY